MLDNLKPVSGSRQKIKRIGRGPGCHGKTSGKGHKGQRSRSGGKVSAWFEGGQSPLKIRTPKRGFHNKFKKEFDIINVGDLNKFKVEVNPEILTEKGFVSGKKNIKVLGNGELQEKLKVIAHSFSKSAKSKIEDKGGIVEII
jgi:large subunit ribosomal protein L15